MADAHDDDNPLERELASTFRPAPMSLELRERIGAELTHARLRRVVRSAAIFAAAACVVIGVVVVVVVATRRADVAVRPPASPTETKHVEPAAAASSPPTVLDYRRAFAKSSESLDELLDRPAGGGGQVGGSRGKKPLRAFTRSFNGDSL